MKIAGEIPLAQFLIGDLIVWDERLWIVKSHHRAPGVGRAGINVIRYVEPGACTFPTWMSLNAWNRRRYPVIHRSAQAIIVGDAECVPNAMDVTMRAHSPVGVN